MKTLYSLLLVALLVLPATAALAQHPDGCLPYPGKLVVHDPEMIAGDYNTGLNSGDETWPDTSALLPPGTTGTLVIGRDPGDGTSPDLGCAPLSNGAEVNGNIALIQRGECGFSLKALHAQEAGAIGVVIWNNTPDDPDALTNMSGGPEGVEIHIASLFASYNTGEALRSQLEDFEVPVNVTLTYDDCYLEGLAAEENVIPGTRELSAAHPNPFASRTQLDLTLDVPQHVSVNVYNVLGQRVATLHEGALSADLHTFAFEASTLPAGVYLVRAVGEHFAQTRQVTLVR